MEKPTREYGVMIHKTTFAERESIIVKVMVRESDQRDYPINPKTDGESHVWGTIVPAFAANLAFDDLRLRTYLANDGEWTLPDVRYEGPHFVDLALAERHVRTLKRINRQIEKDCAREPGDMLASFCKAIGATFYCVPQSERYSMYRDTEWTWYKIPAAREQIRYLMKTIKAANAAVAA